MNQSQPIWVPSEDRIKNSNFSKYYDFLKEGYNLSFSNYHELHNWSVSDIVKFWESIWKFCGIIHSKSYDKILDNRILPGANWFNGSKLNFAENLLRYRDNHIAIISSRENKLDVTLTYKELYEFVAACSSGLIRLGVKRGDRVAGFGYKYS